ncbi:hypothetical protein [Enterococcus sp.]|uniref:hypothetical protein n=1 Tax=Enterococcus sp. TaxID=35783 RepID=UPI00290AF7E8|nr:hypothetical protein [Enterococcus sp.]MDU5337311.1 hypothetical protein [Enterococcus sp.]
MYYHVNERDTKKVIDLLSGIENRQTNQHFLNNMKEVKSFFSEEALVRHILYQNELEILLDSEEQNYIGMFCLWQDKGTYNCNAKVHNLASSVE